MGMMVPVSKGHDEVLQTKQGHLRDTVEEF